MRSLAQPFVRLAGVAVPIDEEARKLFGGLKLKELNVIPFEKVGEASWNVITLHPYDYYELREKFHSSTNQKIHLMYFVEADEFNRVLKSYFDVNVQIFNRQRLDWKKMNREMIDNNWTLTKSSIN